MDRTMNKEQRMYAIAKAIVLEMEERERSLEKYFIANRNIRNLDGSVPERLYCIEDNALFEKSVKEFEALSEVEQILIKQIEAKKDLQKAEDVLIEFALSRIPEKERKLLAKSVKKNASIRKKVIDLAFRLDTSM